MTNKIVDAICDLFHIGADSRTESVLMSNIKNTIRRTECLDEIERRFFTSEIEDEDGEEAAHCMLNWGVTPDTYATQFGEALIVITSASQSSAARDVLAERRRQIEEKGWTPEHDDEHNCQELAMAAACYAGNAGGYVWADGWPGETVWPWDRSCWKPTTPRRDLVKAAAMILAEIERLDRLQPPRGEG